MEQGWHLRHQALSAQRLPFTGINVASFRDHGTAALGVVTMYGENGKYQGITPRVKNFVISQWRPNGEPNEADAILYALYYLNAGDVLLLEMQSYAPSTESKLWPIEIQDAVLVVLQLATALGIIVIEPAGNGNTQIIRGNNLDHFNAHKKRCLYPGSKYFRDSGAIMVGAATCTVPHRRTASANYGKRVNCYAWGEAVTTAGNYPHESASKNCYTPFFNGTSSAAAIIAGCAVCIQSVLAAANIRLLSPADMRTLLSEPALGTPAAGNITAGIGVMPDLKKILSFVLKTADAI